MSHDDSARLVTALMRGGSIAPQVFTLQNPAVLTNLDDVTATGYGCTIVAATTMPVGVRIGDLLRLENCSNIRLKGFRFDGSRDARGGFQNDSQAIHVLSSNDIWLEDLQIRNAVCDGVFIWSGLGVPASAACQRVHLRKCTIDNPGRSCVSLVGAAWSSVIDCDLMNATTSDPWTGVRVEANESDGDGINHHVLIADNRITNTGNAVAVVKKAKPHHVSIVGNVVDGTTSDAIFVEGQDCLIADNLATNYGRCAVSVCNGGTASVSGCPGKLYLEAGNTLDGVLCAAPVTVTK